jgi:hypothetical protein
MDPSNVYANAMLGHWLRENNGSLSEVFQDFDNAVETGRERPYVRVLQLDALIYNDNPQARVELIKVINGMRKNHEPLGDDNKRRISTFNYNESTYDRRELVESLSAVPHDESLATYIWLGDRQNISAEDRKWRQLRQDYMSANLLELSGKKSEALAQYKLLQAKLKGSNSTLISAVEDAIKRLAAT